MADGKESEFQKGEISEERKLRIEKAKEAWLASARESGKPIPPPRYRPVIYQTTK